MKNLKENSFAFVCFFFLNLNAKILDKADVQHLRDLWVALHKKD